MRKIVIIAVVSFVVGFAAFTDSVDKLRSKEWFMAIIALSVAVIFAKMFFIYIEKLKKCEEEIKKPLKPTPKD